MQGAAWPAVPDEHSIQKAIVRYLDLALPPDQRIVAVSNNPRSRVSGAFEKARGMRAGFPDLILVGRVWGLIKVKAERGRLSKDQMQWLLWCDGHGFNYRIVRSIEDIRETMIAWGVKLSERVHL